MLFDGALGKQRDAERISQAIDILRQLLASRTSPLPAIPDILSEEFAADTLIEQGQLAKAQDWLRKQKRRERFLPKEIFKDLAWNILLDIYVEEGKGRQVSVTSACTASGGAQGTALRWIRLLDELGLIVRKSDSQDRRRFYLTLTQAGRDGIEGWLSD